MGDYIFKTLLDVFFCHQTWQFGFHWKKRQRVRPLVMRGFFTSPFGVEFKPYHPLTWASCVAYLSERQPRPDDGVSKGMTPTSFFVSVRIGGAEPKPIYDEKRR